jgi:hypothetical protein
MYTAPTGQTNPDRENRRQGDTGNPSTSTPGNATPQLPGDPPLAFGKPAALLRFAESRSLLVSGMLAGGEALANRAAIIDIPAGKGHVLLFAINPMWRMQTQGSYPFIFNAALHYNFLNRE